MTNSPRTSAAHQLGGTTAAQALAAVRRQLADGQGALTRGAHGTAWSILRPLAEMGIVEAQNTLGVIYAQGAGVVRDPALAVFWYRKAAEQGFAPAAFNLGVAYAEGDGVARDPAQAALWKGRAADRGYHGPTAEATADHPVERAPRRAKDQSPAPSPSELPESFQAWKYPHLTFRQIEDARRQHQARAADNNKTAIDRQ